MLNRGDSTFCTGCARYRDHLPFDAEGSPKIFVRFTLPLRPAQTLEAQLDTGAAWSVLESSIARAANLSASAGQSARLQTRLGTVRGHLHRIAVTLLADEGHSLDVDATVFVSPEWSGGNFLGYGGLLERIRFAVDPASNRFYFGRAD